MKLWSIGKTVAIGYSILAWLVIVGCAASASYRSASGDRISPQTLQEAEAKVAAMNPPAPLKRDLVAYFSEGPRNEVLHAMRVGLGAMRLGEWSWAREFFGRARAGVEAIGDGARDARRAESHFVAESQKWFRGEPYERSALYFYRGLLFLREGDWANAAASFKRVQLMDVVASGSDAQAGDWRIAELGLALAELKRGRPEEAQRALNRAAALGVPKEDFPTADCQWVMLVESGRGPIKVGGGRHGELLQFAAWPRGIEKIRVEGGSQPRVISPQEDLLAQALGRGRREVDELLASKADTRDAAGMAAVALGSGAVIASMAEESGIVAGALALGAVGSATVAGLTRAEADLRSWDLLPRDLTLVFGRTRPSPDGWQVSGLDQAGAEVVSAQIQRSETHESESSRLVLVMVRL